MDLQIVGIDGVADQITMAAKKRRDHDRDDGEAVKIGQIHRITGTEHNEGPKITKNQPRSNTGS